MRRRGFTTAMRGCGIGLRVRREWACRNRYSSCLSACVWRRTGKIGVMARKVNCVLLKREAEGLAYLPYPGELGKRIYESISKEAWAQWVAHQTMLINENRLTPIEPKARAFLVAEMEKFLFGAGSEKPKEFVPK